MKVDGQGRPVTPIVLIGRVLGVAIVVAFFLLFSVAASETRAPRPFYPGEDLRVLVVSVSCFAIGMAFQFVIFRAIGKGRPAWMVAIAALILLLAAAGLFFGLDAAAQALVGRKFGMAPAPLTAGMILGRILRHLRFDKPAFRGYA